MNSNASTPLLWNCAPNTYKVAKVAVLYKLAQCCLSEKKKSIKFARRRGRLSCGQLLTAQALFTIETFKLIIDLLWRQRVNFNYNGPDQTIPLRARKRKHCPNVRRQTRHRVNNFISFESFLWCATRLEWPRIPFNILTKELLLSLNQVLVLLFLLKT